MVFDVNGPFLQIYVPKSDEFLICNSRDSLVSFSITSSPFIHLKTRSRPSGLWHDKIEVLPQIGRISVVFTSTERKCYKREKTQVSEQLCNEAKDLA